MKKTMYLLTTVALIIASAAGCGGIKYCEVDGCPREVVSADYDYCTEHECGNYSCRNKAVRSWGYCEECLNAGNS